MKTANELYLVEINGNPDSVVADANLIEAIVAKSFLRFAISAGEAAASTFSITC